MVKIMENPMNKWMIWGENPLFSETSIYGCYGYFGIPCSTSRVPREPSMHGSPSYRIIATTDHPSSHYNKTEQQQTRNNNIVNTTKQHITSTINQHTTTTTTTTTTNHQPPATNHLILFQKKQIFASQELAFKACATDSSG